VKYTPHELSLAFPEMAPDQYKRHADDVKANGLHHAIVLFEGQILDGRHRYRACLEAGIEPRFVEFTGADPVAYVTSENGARRHLSESQLAHAVAAMKPYEERKAHERQLASLKRGDSPLPPIGGDGRSGRVSEILALKSGVGARSVERAIKVREQGTPELNAAVAAGEIALSQAEKIVHLNPAAQRKIVEAPKALRSDEIRTAINRSDGSKRRDKIKAAGGPVFTDQPSTSFVRKYLSGLERIAMVCAEDGAKDGAAIATKFLAEMDWNVDALAIQFERCEPIFRALAIIQQHVDSGLPDLNRADLAALVIKDGAPLVWGNCRVWSAT
jgi:hypothetical protein